MKEKYHIRARIVGATPLICVIVYLALGFTLNIWHPTWVVFFLIPIMPIILKDDYGAFYPVLCVAVYLALGFTLNLWHPLWLIFLTIPVFYTLFGPLFKRRKKKIEVIEEK